MRPDQWRRQPGPVALAAFCAALMICHQVVAKALRDALFLSAFPSADLPKAMLAAALLGVPSVLAAARVMGRVGPGRLVPGLILASATLHALEFLAIERWPGPTAVLVYLHVSVGGALTISGFWSVVNERFDPHAARRAIAMVTGGAALGGLCGGLLGRSLGELGAKAMLLSLVGLGAMSALLVLRLGHGSSASLLSTRAASAIVSLRDSSYLRKLALFVALTSFCAALIDFAFKMSAAEAHSGAPDLVRFFAVFYTATSVVTVLFQLGVSRFILDQVGLGGALAVLPGALISLGVLALGAPGTLTFSLLRGAENTLQGSLFRSAYETLYTPVAPSIKRSAKTIIDVAFDRAGEAIASGFVLLLLWFLPGLAPRIGVATAVAIGGVCMYMAMRLQKGYVEELAASLRAGRIHLDETHVGDATTRLAVSQTALEIDRAELLRQIQALRSQDGHSGERGSRPTSARPSVEPIVAWPRAAELASGDVARIQAALTSAPLEPPLVSLVIPMLAHDELNPAAVKALLGVAERSAGQLVDVLLDPEQPLKLRRRIPRVLRSVAAPRAARGLSDGLFDPEFDVRQRSAVALLRMIEQRPELRPPRRLVYDAAERELSLDSNNDACFHPDALDDEQGGVARGPGSAFHRGIEHIFTLLGLALDREALDLAVRALAGSDVKLRGTALEYLENVLPDTIRTELVKRLSRDLPRKPVERRPSKELVEELKRSMG
jgi:ATP:ADP antiporter, AAA family